MKGKPNRTLYGKVWTKTRLQNNFMRRSRSGLWGDLMWIFVVFYYVFDVFIMAPFLSFFIPLILRSYGPLCRIQSFFFKQRIEFFGMECLIGYESYSTILPQILKGMNIIPSKQIILQYTTFLVTNIGQFPCSIIINSNCLLHTIGIHKSTNYMPYQPIECPEVP